MRRREFFTKEFIEVTRSNTELIMGTSNMELVTGLVKVRSTNLAFVRGRSNLEVTMRRSNPEVLKGRSNLVVIIRKGNMAVSMANTQVVFLLFFTSKYVSVCF